MAQLPDSREARARVLIVEDDAAMRAVVQKDLARRGFAVEVAASAGAALAALERFAPDIVVTDLRMPGLDGLELCRRILHAVPETDVVVITAFGSLDSAVEAIRAGAYDFINKPFELEELALTVERAAERRELRETVRSLERIIGAERGVGELIGQSEPMRRLHDEIERVAPTEASVLIGGETGTGKELVAQTLHRGSPRAGGPFVAVNCAALPGNLMEAELFGHARGAFTDARVARPGLLASADGGTLFLDELGDLEPALQPKLLRALEERRYRPVGSDQEVRFDARLVAASKHDLVSAVEEGRFREDLYYRVAVCPIHVPPLRERGRDILLLAQHFVRSFALRSTRDVSGLDAEAADRMLRYRWPGNVRELRNVIERAVALTRHPLLRVEDLPEVIRRYREERFVVAGAPVDALLPMHEIERRYVQHVLDAVGGNQSEAARVLGLDRKTLRRKLERYRSEDGPSPSTP